MLKLAVFNLIKYSFNMKTWVSDRAILQRQTFEPAPYVMKHLGFQLMKLISESALNHAYSIS